MGFGEHIRDLSKVFKPEEHVKVKTSDGEEFHIKPAVRYELKNSEIKQDHIDEMFQYDECVIKVLLNRYLRHLKRDQDVMQSLLERTKNKVNVQEILDFAESSNL